MLDTVTFDEMVDHNVNHGYPNHISYFYNGLSKSILNQIRKKKIRKFDQSYVDQWIRMKFPINEDQLVVEKNRIGAIQVSKFLLRKTSNYKITSLEVRSILELEKEIETQRSNEQEKISSLKNEIHKIREQKRLRKPRKVKIQSLSRKTKIRSEPINQKTISSMKPMNSYLDRDNCDMIYSQWMEHVSQKSTSKSYWYIHEYLARFILKFALEKNATSINKNIVELFMESYGKGKAAKTINHYT